jgi:hypothetical protein
MFHRANVTKEGARRVSHRERKRSGEDVGKKSRALQHIVRCRERRVFRSRAMRAPLLAEQ